MDACKELEEERSATMQAGDWATGMKVQKALDRAKFAKVDCMKREHQAEIMEDVKRKREAAERAHEAFQEETKEVEADLEARIQRNYEVVKNRQEKDREEHDSQWSAEKKQRQFNRSSQRLRVLRIQQQLLVNSGRFDEAYHVARIADQLAAQETLESHRQMFAAFLQSRMKLEKKQEEEMDTFVMTMDLRRGEFRFAKETQERRFRNRFSALKVEENSASDPEKLWARKRDRNEESLRGSSTVVVKSRGVATTQMRQRQTTSLEYNTLHLPPLPRLPSKVRREPGTGRK
jgi:hypothetical protein